MNSVRSFVRSAVRQPALNLLIVGLCALGVALSASVFGLVKNVLLDPLPYRDSEQLYVPWGVAESFGIDTYPFSFPNYEDHRAGITAFEDLAAWRSAPFTVDAGDVPRSIQGLRVTENFLRVIGVEPILGAGFAVTADGHVPPAQALVSERLWRTELGGDATAIGSTLRLDGDTFEIVGVLPRHLRYPTTDLDVVIPLELAPGPEQNRAFHFLRLLGRLSPDRTLEEAEQQALTVAADLAERFPDASGELSIRLASLHGEIVGRTEGALQALFGAVQVLFVVALTNMAILLLARGVGRGPELRVRAALGATRGRLVRLVVAEAVGLAAIGCALGLLGGRLLLEGLRGLDATLLPRADELALDPAVVAFAIVSTLLGAVLFGLIPALAATHDNARDSVGGRATDRDGRRLNGRLAVAQVALVLPLLVGAAAQLRAVNELNEVDLGYPTETTLTAGVSLPLTQFGEPAVQREYVDRARAELAALPGVEAVGMLSRLPLAPGNAAIVTYRPDQAGQSDLPNANYRVVSPGLFGALGIPLEAGRELEADDDADSRWVVLVNRRLADALWPGEDAIGKEVRLGTDTTLREVVGVVPSVRHLAPDTEPGYSVYVPIEQNLFAAALRTPAFVIRTTPSPATLASAVRDTLQRVEPDQAVLEVRPLAAQLDDWLADRRALASLLWAISAAALLLACAGLYAVLTFALGQRLREMAVRCALGAGPLRLARGVIADGLRPAAIGALIGLGASLALARWLAARAYELPPLDLAGTTVAVVLVLAAGLVAAALPARRLLRTDPAPLLRGDTR